MGFLVTYGTSLGWDTLNTVNKIALSLFLCSVVYLQLRLMISRSGSKGFTHAMFLLIGFSMFGFTFLALTGVDNIYTISYLLLMLPISFAEPVLQRFLVSADTKFTSLLRKG